MRRLLILAALALAGCATGQKDDYAHIVQEVLGKGLGGDMAVVEKYIPPDYIQHNPMAEDGRAGLVKFIEYLQSQPAEQRPTIKTVRIFRDGDYVFAHSEMTAGGSKSAVMDVWRVGDGKLLEHWDCIQPHPADTASGRGMVDGAVEITDREKTEANKQMIRKFADEVLSRRDLANFDDYVAENLIQHDPNVQDGREAWRASLEWLKGAEFKYTPVRVIGEGNFVLVQSKLTVGDEYVTYELFRLEDGKVAEHWTTTQPVPENPANDNGMLP